MRLVSHRGGNGLRAGLELADGTVADTQALAAAAGWDAKPLAAAAANRTLLAHGTAQLGELVARAEEERDALVAAGRAWRAGDVALGPPVPDPGKLICLGLNYADHAAEVGAAAPAEPMFFAKWANSLIGPRDTIVVPSVAAAQVDYEAELVVVIGRRGRDIAEADALAHVAGAMAFNDVSARDLQLANPLWTGGKAVDTFGPCGPALVPLPALGDLGDLGVRAWVNGRLVQDGRTSSMIHPVARTIAFLSRVMTLEPGDLIATGTPAGVGVSRTPPLYLVDGDVVEVEVEGVGRLRNPVSSRPCSSATGA